MTRFFVRIKNVNKRSEGKAHLCLGFVTLDKRTYRAEWQDGYAGNTFGQEALLHVFYIDKDPNTINFIHTVGAAKTVESISYLSVVSYSSCLLRHPT
jgi:hypothetical protein